MPSSRRLLLVAVITCWASVAAAQTGPDAQSPPTFDPVAMISVSQPEAVAPDLGELASRKASSAVGSWSFTSDAMLLQRSSGDHIPVAIGTPTSYYPPAIGPPYTLGAEDVDFKTAAGWRLGATRRGEQFDTEVAYFQVDDFAAQTDASGCVSVPFRTQTGNLFGVDLLNPRFDYHSQLSSVECNVRRPYSPWLALLAGLRYARLDENYALSGRLEDVWGYPPLLATTAFRAQNNLYGLQLGADAALLRRNRLTIQSEIKGGIYYDAIRRDGQYGELPLLANWHQDQAAFLGELGLTAIYQLTNHLRLRAGYQLMWLDGVGLATDPITLREYFADGELPGSGVLDSKNTVFYHGALFGAELTW